MPYATSDGAEVFYTDTGGAGPVLVLGHGFLLTQQLFEPQQRGLGDAVRVIAWDARGHGDTISSGPFDYWDLARDALAVMDAAGVERAVVGGMSQGGFSALRVALLAPARVTGLILIGTTSAACSGADAADYRKLFTAWAGDAPLGALMTPLAAQLVGGTPADRAPWTDLWAASDRQRIIEPGACLIGREAVTNELGEILCPALIVRGAQDEAFDLAAAKELGAGLSRASALVEVPGAGHAVNWTHPGQVNAAITKFLCSNPALRSERDQS